MTARELWQEIYQRFDPEESVPVERPGWRADRTYSPTQDILEQLALPFAPARVILLGTTGTGKTTELRRVAEARANDDFVVFLDLVDHFSKVVGNPEALERIQTWEVCFLAGLAAYRAAEERLGFTWPPDVLQGLADAWTALARSTQTPAPPAGQLDLGKLARSMVLLASAVVPGSGLVGAGLKALEGATESLKWNLLMGQSKVALPDDDPLVRGMLAAVNRILGELQLRHRRALLIIDGLDRIREIDRARALFIDSNMLPRLASAVLLCGPFALRHHTAVVTVRGFQKIFALVNEPVLRQDQPSEPGNGVAFFWDVFRRRVQDLTPEEILPHEQLVRLSYYSGGRARDFVRSVRNLAAKAYVAQAARADAALVDKVLDDERRFLEMGMHTGHIELLRAVMRDPAHSLPQDELVWSMLQESRLLPYPNETEWFYPHPLLTIKLVRP